MSRRNDFVFDKNGKKRTRCEVYSRVVGYIRPVEQWNNGKQAEYEDRKMFLNDNQTKI